MISPIAVLLAAAFWAPYNNGQPICPNGVQIMYDQATPDAMLGWVEPQDIAARDCRIHLRADLGDQQIPKQCQIIAHELGHAAMGLEDDPLGPPGIMNAGPSWSIPGACYPPKQAKPRASPSGTRRWLSRRPRSIAQRVSGRIVPRHLAV